MWLIDNLNQIDLGFIVSMLALMVGIINLALDLYNAHTTLLETLLGERAKQLWQKFIWCRKFSGMLKGIKHLYRRITATCKRRMVAGLSICPVLLFWSKKRRDIEMLKVLGIPQVIVPTLFVYWLGSVKSCIRKIYQILKIWPAFAFAWRKRHRDLEMLAMLNAPLCVAPSIAVYWQREMRRC